MSTIPFVGGPLTDEVGDFNRLIAAINAGVNGILSADPVAVASTAIASEQNLKTFILPPNLLAAPGQGLRVRAWGITAANTTSKVLSLYFGSVTASAFTTAISAQQWAFDMLVLRGSTAALQMINALHMAGLVGAANNPTNTAGTVDLSAAVTIRLAATMASGAAANDVTAQALLVEQIK